MRVKFYREGFFSKLNETVGVRQSHFAEKFYMKGFTYSLNIQFTLRAPLTGGGFFLCGADPLCRFDPAYGLKYFVIFAMMLLVTEVLYGCTNATTADGAYF